MIERKLVRLFSFYSFLSTVTTELLTSLIKKNQTVVSSPFLQTFLQFSETCYKFSYTEKKYLVNV